MITRSPIMLVDYFFLDRAKFYFFLANFPVMNTITHIWDILLKKVVGLFIPRETIQQFESFLLQECEITEENPSPLAYHNFTVSMRHRFATLFLAKKNHTFYWNSFWSKTYHEYVRLWDILDLNIYCFMRYIVHKI